MKTNCVECDGTGKIDFTKERGGPICPNCGGNGHLTDQIIQRNIASIIDYPSVYMGGASRNALNKAEKILNFLKEQKLVLT